MRLSLSPRELRTLLPVGAVAVLFLWVYSAYIVGPMWHHVIDLGKAVQDARGQLTTLQQATANEAALREQHRQLDDSVVSLRTLLPSEEELPSVIEFLSDLARQTQVKIQTIFPQHPLTTDVGTPENREKAKKLDPSLVYKEIPIQIDAQTPYHQLGAFLSLVEGADKPMYVSSLRIVESPKEPRWHNITMVILAYFAVKEGTSVGK